ncbi:hypothetical protein EJ04DRAFT_466863 [Polyplosphaeria fusca]|uniref:Zinc finger CHCC-type domain-containing protein n=1 Tax=Polyplosphaeria fusca TaxID=682080 RepID=A0A9P4R098_9PLEO|nr:hypothetical protein EJ04DRAFT_466863 [Polyplosphaeria fusca]
MLSRTLRTRIPVRRLPSLVRAVHHPTTSDSPQPVPANDPNPRPANPNVSATNAAPTSSIGSMDQVLQESVEKGEELRVMQAPNRQAPNRKATWSTNQQPREVAMSGPRFEQTIFADQPRPYAAIDLIHKQPVRWVKERIVACDGGGGPLGHPRIFINTDKPQIAPCGYCGLPFANEHHRKHLESLPSTPYPLGPSGDPAEVQESQRITDEPLGQR